MAIDSHAHVQDYPKLAAELLEKVPVLPIGIGYDLDSSYRLFNFPANIPKVYGISPQRAQDDPSQVNKLADFLQQANNFVAIGEIGLDWHWGKTETQRKNQREVFIKQLELAENFKKPVVIHCREAYKEVISILSEHFSGKIIFHFFSGTVSDYRIIQKKLDSKISIVARRSKQRQEVIKVAGLEDLLVETDSPYVFRDFFEVYKAISYISEVKGINPDEVETMTEQNAIEVFKLSPERFPLLREIRKRKVP